MRSFLLYTSKCIDMRTANVDRHTYRCVLHACVGACAAQRQNALADAVILSTGTPIPAQWTPIGDADVEGTPFFFGMGPFLDRTGPAADHACAAHRGQGADGRKEPGDDMLVVNVSVHSILVATCLL